jgi:hypothetical protein
MRPTMKNLPFSVAYFKRIIEGNHVYVDKTDILADLVRIPDAQLFLSRPRRFGKSMLLSTIAEIFQGNPDTFRGLKIMDSGYEFVKHPVIFLDMSLDSRSPEKLEKDLLFKLDKIARQEDLRIQEESPRTALEVLIDALYDKYDQNGVVILVDEYDHPVSSNLDEPDLAAANTKILKTFYGSLKTVTQAGKLHFVLVTGATRYAMLGTSGGLNQL